MDIKEAHFELVTSRNAAIKKYYSYARWVWYVETSLTLSELKDTYDERTWYDMVREPYEHVDKFHELLGMDQYFILEPTDFKRQLLKPSGHNYTWESFWHDILTNKL